MRVVLRLNDQQLGALRMLGALDELPLWLARAVAHDRARPVDPTRAQPRPAGRAPSPPGEPGRDVLVEAGTALGVALRGGDVVRVEQVVEGQCADVNLFPLGDALGRRFDAARTRAAHGLRVTTGAVLWSTAPELDLAEIGADSAGPHDLGFPACSAWEFEQITGQHDHSNCVALQQEAQRHWGLEPSAAHDPLNLWLVSDALPDGRLCFWPAACRVGDFVELRARRDVLVVVNPCASDLYGSAQWELGPVRVLVRPADPALPPPAAPTGPEPVWRWRDLPLREHVVELTQDDAAHVAAVRAQGWLGLSDDDVARALLLRWWEHVVLDDGDVSR